MDPLEDVLALLGATSRISTSLAAGGSWAIEFGPPAGVKFNSVRRGRCHLRIEGRDAPYDLEPGDCFLLTRPRPFTLFSDPAAVPAAAGPIFRAAVDGVARAGDGDDVFMIGGAFSFGDRARTLLLDDLPPVVHVPAAAEEAAGVRWAIGQIDTELRHRRLGSTLVAEHLALVMLIQVLRVHLMRDAPHTSGWLAGTSDPVVSVALRRIHLRPAHPWTVEELARAAGVSRSTMAARFGSTVGMGPLEYLTDWRIELAADRLRRGDGTVATIAREVGYGSESAFSVAFKRVIGISPGAYRRKPKPPPVAVSG
ncbi:AraC family transcriptional regulator [Actinomadura sp. NAK00032]|uniref:AraC family transcriptional regulator n=1 Tax=Actinomadura sp. NAK00032 TaxID=2742128 RepID=UPI001590E97D|nr:AraC family transcriptional regulator [Actinomadura sp. NAK00032]QKW38018.1 AraC family transcriptional regulator [Actinomadura sp. NAK00032]